eukprot:TRINITY_DN48563_c0_g1_i2.p1 TRINITY_DN48563_c0_g1~~TRINITY_DN48563_c0_g1_i2.p1  ORF type:complete len:261 (+),score=79.26 TRINITY_DN48563_c0_g1_i2:160-942(+)
MIGGAGSPPAPEASPPTSPSELQSSRSNGRRGELSQTVLGRLEEEERAKKEFAGADFAPVLSLIETGKVNYSQGRQLALAAKLRRQSVSTEEVGFEVKIFTAEGRVRCVTSMALSAAWEDFCKETALSLECSEQDVAGKVYTYADEEGDDVQVRNQRSFEEAKKFATRSALEQLEVPVRLRLTEAEEIQPFIGSSMSFEDEGRAALAKVLEKELTAARLRVRELEELLKALGHREEGAPDERGEKGEGEAEAGDAGHVEF